MGNTPPLETLLNNSKKDFFGFFDDVATKFSLHDIEGIKKQAGMYENGIDYNVLVGIKRYNLEINYDKNTNEGTFKISRNSIFSRKKELVELKYENNVWKVNQHEELPPSIYTKLTSI